MPTDRPKVQGYVPQVVYDKLVEFKDSYDLRSISEAVTLALQEFFGIKASNSEVNQSELLDRVGNLEREVSTLTEQLLALHQIVAGLTTSKSKQGLLSESEFLPSKANTTVDRSNLPMNQSNSPFVLISDQAIEADDSLEESESSVNHTASLINNYQDEPQAHLSDLQNDSPRSKAQTLIERENIDSSESLTALELAKLLGVTDRSITGITSKGHETFQEWSRQRSGNTWDFEVLKPGAMSLRRRLYRID